MDRHDAGRPGMDRHDARPLETRIADLAAGQHGVVTRAQLLEAGVTTDMVDERVRSRRLRPLHRGVYLHGALVGALEPARARVMAAVLACGPGAVVSHDSAGRLWKLLRPHPDGNSAPVHVTVLGVDRGRRSGIRPHRVADLPAEDVTMVEGVPVTAPARTLVDLAARVRRRTLEQAIAEAERRELVDLDDLVAVSERRSGTRGMRLLRQVLAGRDGPAFTRSVAEEQFLALTRRGGLPDPETNVRMGEYEVDFLWRSEGVVVEVDGFTYHGSRRPFEGDRRRDARLSALGLRPIRVTWRQLADEPHAVLVRLAQILALARPRGQEGPR